MRRRPTSVSGRGAILALAAMECLACKVTDLDVRLNKCPICFKWVLRRAGEVTQRAGVGEANAQDGATVASGDSVVADGGSRV